MKRCVCAFVAAGAVFMCGHRIHAAIGDVESITIDFAPGRVPDGLEHAPHLQVGEAGLHWQGKGARARVGPPRTWVRTQPLAIGYPWAIPTGVSVFVTVERTYRVIPGYGEKDLMRVYFRYSVDAENWSIWIQVPARSGKLGLLGTFDHHYSLAMPGSTLERHLRLLSRWREEDGSGDMSRFYRWVEQNHPERLRTDIARIGYVQLLVEWPGARVSELSVSRLRVGLSWCLGGACGTRMSPERKPVETIGDIMLPGGGVQRWRFGLQKRAPGPAARAEELMRRFERGAFVRGPGSGIHMGWTMPDSRGREHSRSTLQRQTEQIVPLGRDAVPVLLRWLDHSDGCMRYIAAYSLKQITGMDPTFYYFATPGEEYNGDAEWHRKCVEAWRGWYEGSRSDAR